MKEIAILSGKGGTGKTSITAALAACADDVLLADCDVDAADLHLIVTPTIEQTHEFVGGKEASIRQADCAGCGLCKKLCRFQAIVKEPDTNTYKVDPLACEGCKVCVEFCPIQAIDFVDAVNGRWFVSKTRLGPMVHAELGIAQENSGKLVSLIRKKAKKLARQQELQWILVDGSPGIGCPVIASITGADAVLIVTEPTQSGMHDLMRVTELLEHFGMRGLVCINKWDLNTELAMQLEQFTQGNGMPIVGKIPYDGILTKAQLQAKTVIEMGENSVSEIIKNMWNRIQKQIIGTGE